MVLHYRATYRLAPILLLLLLMSPGMAQPAGPIGVEEHQELGQYLVDQDGLALYVFLPDEAGESTCYEQCSESWPPFHPTAQGVTAQEEIDESLLGSLERTDGSLQVAYNDWPLYYFSGDEEAGDANGQGRGGNWFLISPTGDILGTPQDETPEETPQEEPGTQDDSADGNESVNSDDGVPQGTSDDEVPPDVPAAPGEDATSPDTTGLADEGRGVYGQHCASCHGAQGDQATAGATRLAGYSGLDNDGRVIRQVLYGGEFMPAFGDVLSDHQVAAVLTYVRSSFGNDYDPITEEAVVEVRDMFE